MTEDELHAAVKNWVETVGTERATAFISLFEERFAGTVHDRLAATHDSPEYACGLDAALPPATERN
jgi:hypothetical protein